MLVLGVDPGSHATGYGVIETAPTLRQVAGGVIRTKKAADLPSRLLTIHAVIVDVVQEHRPVVMAVEDLFNARNPRSSLVLGHARGVIVLAGAQSGLTIAGYAPREIKQAVTGSGAASKEQVRFMIMRLLRLREQPPLDQSDALAVAITYVNRSSVQRRLSASRGRA